MSDKAKKEEHLNPDITLRDFVDRSEIALQKIRDVVDGNLLHPLEDVELLSYEEVFLEFQAHNRFTPHRVRAEKIISRIPPGVQKVRGKTELDTVSEKEMYTALRSQTPLNELKAQLLKRDDKGYFLDKERLPIVINPLMYLREEPCNECRGQKLINCVDCEGRGYRPCQNCRGQQGNKGCNICKGRGEVQCIKCQTKGKKKCHNCRAFGYVNHLTQIKLYADSNFSYEKDEVPVIAIGVLDRLREKLITKEHAAVSISDDIKASEKDFSDSIMTLTYDVRLPLGDAMFRIGDEKIPALIFGYKVALLDVPPFLERYMLKPYNLLEEAAKGHGNISGKIRTAAYQTKLTNETVLGVASRGAGPTERALKHKYSVALEPLFIHNLVRSARLALDKLIVKPQMVGMVIGLVPSILLILLYIFVMSSGGVDTHQKLRFVLDAIIMLFAVFLPYLGAQILSRQSLIYALGHRVKKKLRLPNLGWRGILGPGFAFLAFIYFSELAFSTNPFGAPQSFAVIREMLTEILAKNT
jgi:hypothetical protein